MELNSKTAIITGAASGIGRGTAVALAAHGARVIAADVDDKGAEETAAQIRAAGGEAVAQHCDVAEDDALEKLRDAALKQFGRVDVVMNNVGVLTQGLPEYIPLAEWQRIININLMSVVRSNLAFLPLLIKQGSGHIVNTASFAGLYTYSFDRLPYAASKAAIIQISEGLSLYLRPKGIGVTCLCPGPVITNITESLRSFGPKTETVGTGNLYAPLDPKDVGEMVVNAIIENRFMLPTHEQVRTQLIERASDWDGFLARQAEAIKAA